MPAPELDNLAINTIRFLSVDAVEKAKSGHPGLPMGAAAMAYVLWTRFLKHNPKSPKWPDRDRFVLSGGHGSMLLYSLLHLTGYDLPLEEIRRFRQWDSRTPGHPESHVTPGVDATTGPLGQGISNAVGMAIAEAHLAARFNRPGREVVDHRTYVIASDGDLMEGVASEACSLAGHLRLGKLIVLYDDNQITLAGSTSVSFSEDVGERFRAYGWHVERVRDGNDLDSVDQALRNAQAAATAPSLLLVRTRIGFGAPKKEGTYEVHGSPLGAEELAAAKAKASWPAEPSFHLPAEALAHFRQAVGRGAAEESRWRDRLGAYAKEFPELGRELERRLDEKLPSDWTKALPSFPADEKGMATRKASETVMQALAKSLPELIGGSADLNNSTFTWLKDGGDFQSSSAAKEGVQGTVGGPWGFEGRNLHFGVREHGMGAAVNGMAYHGGVIPYGATFLQFADYMRAAIRLSALSEIGSIWVFTHDSVALGEDGPTHQPVEHFAALRAIPSLVFIRPADANETAWAWRVAIENRHRPTALALTRQNVPTLDRTEFAPADGLVHGAYVLNPKVESPDVVLLATGSEVGLIVAASEILAGRGVKSRLVSMPSWELFDAESADYRESVLLEGKPRLAVEAGIALGWHRWIGERGATLTIDRFGASAPGDEVLKRLGFTAENVAEKAAALLNR